MRTTFVITPSGQLVSEIRPKSCPHMLRAGMSVELANPYIVGVREVPAGATGFILCVDEESGMAVIAMDVQHPALFQWDNELVLSPFTTEDLLACICLPVDRKPPLRTHMPHEESHAVA